MFINGLEPNTAISKELGSRIQRQRINMGKTQAELAEKAGVSLRTLINIESGNECKLSNLFNVLRAENLLGNIQLLVPEEQINPMDILTLDKERRRVRKKNSEPKTWIWGDEK